MKRDEVVKNLPMAFLLLGFVGVVSAMLLGNQRKRQRHPRKMDEDPQAPTHVPIVITAQTAVDPRTIKFDYAVNDKVADIRVFIEYCKVNNPGTAQIGQRLSLAASPAQNTKQVTGQIAYFPGLGPGDKVLVTIIAIDQNRHDIYNVASTICTVSNAHS